MSVVAGVEAWPVNVPLEAPYLMAPGVYPGMSRTVVRVTTADGVVGLGETPAAEDADLLLAMELAGRGCGELRLELGRSRPSPARDGATVVTRDPLVGIEMALWDIAAREAGLPLCELLGDVVRSEIPFSEYFAPRPGREETPTAIARYCARMVEEHDSPAFEGKVAVQSPGEDIETVRLVREAIGRDRELRLDANMGWSLATASRMVTELEPYGIANLEEPVASSDDLVELRRRCAIPFSSHTTDPGAAAARGVPDTIVAGISACGGIAGTLRFVDLCRSLGVGFWFYSGDLGIATAAELHMAAVLPTLERRSQSLLRWTADDVTEQGVRTPTRGVLSVPDGPGLGVTLDERALARCVERYAREGPYDLYTVPLPRW